MNLAENLGKVAYDAYAETRDHHTADGKELPEWDRLPEASRVAWIAASSAVVSTITSYALDRVQELFRPTTQDES